MPPPPEIDDALLGLVETAPAAAETDWRKQQLKDRLFGGPAEPRKVGRFIVLGTLGHGGMGSVLRAYDETLDRQVAVKLMHASTQRDRDRRMLREAQALARLSHPNVVQVYEVGEIEGQMFIAMELVAGQTLEQWHGAQRHPWRECLEVYLQAGRGLAAAHAAGMIHRDFKPANCVIDEQGRVRVLDFGLVRHGGDAVEEPAEADVPEPIAHRADSGAHGLSALEEQLTQDGSVMGTLAYMAPEQLRGRDVGTYSDQFSFCVSLYESLFGERPFPVNPMRALLKMSQGKAVEPNPPPVGSRVPRWLVRALFRGLCARPEDRWPSMDALIAELDRRRKSTWARWGSWVVAVGGVAWAVVGWAQGGPDCEEAKQEAKAAWSEEHQRRVRKAIIATELPYAEQTWLKVEPKLSRYARELIQSQGDACGNLDESSGPRRSCLDRSTGRLVQVVSRLEEADAQVVENAAQLVAELPRTEQCRQQRTVDNLDPEQRRNLDRARSQARVGKHDDARETLSKIVDANEREDPIFLAEVWMAEGYILQQAGQFEDAEGKLTKALETALKHDEQAVALEAVKTLAYLVGIENANNRAGLWLGLIAKGLAGRHDLQGMLKGETLTVMAQLLSDGGRYSEAEERYGEALEILGEELGKDHLDLAVPLNGLGQVLTRQRRFGEAQEHYEQALEIRIGALGDRHPKVAFQHGLLGDLFTLSAQSQNEEQSQHALYAKAEGQYVKALKILEGISSDPKTTAKVHAGFGVMLDRRDRPIEAERQLRLAIKDLEAAYPSKHPDLARGYLNLGKNLEHQKNREQAIAQYELALQIIEDNESTAASDVIHLKILEYLGRVHTEQEQYSDAESRYRQALEYLHHRGRARELESAKFQIRLGDLHDIQQHWADAAQAHDEARSILEDLNEPVRLALALFKRGRALYAQGYFESALDHLGHAKKKIERLDYAKVDRSSSSGPRFSREEITELETLLDELESTERPNPDSPKDSAGFVR